MASALAHEINQPLTAVTNYLETARRVLARADAEAGARAAGILENASAQVVRSAEIVRRLRDFVRKGESEQRPEQIGRLVEEALALALTGVGVGRAKADLRIVPELPEIAVDRIQIQQVVVNLVRNAIDAMEGGARQELTVTAATADGGGVEISVADTGPGIAPEVADRLFQPFVTTKRDGMGVGLSICRAIVEAHGGVLIAEFQSCRRRHLSLHPPGRSLKCSPVELSPLTQLRLSLHNPLPPIWGKGRVNWAARKVQT